MEQIRLRERRFHEHAYLFVLSALEYCQSRLSERRHIGGRELAGSCRIWHSTGSASWRARSSSTGGSGSTGDIGDVVFTLVDLNLLISQPTDSRPTSSACLISMRRSSKTTRGTSSNRHERLSEPSSHHLRPLGPPLPGNSRRFADARGRARSQLGRERACDEAAIAGRHPSRALMRAAGMAAAGEIARRFGERTPPAASRSMQDPATMAAYAWVVRGRPRRGGALGPRDRGREHPHRTPSRRRAAAEA